MYTPSVASSSRLTMLDFWYPPSISTKIPISECRSTPPPTRTHFRPSSAHSSPVSSSTPAPPLTLAHLHPTHLPLRTQISPGVWSDGITKVYSSALPEVQRLLVHARRTLTLPAKASDIVLTLAALDVFYKPADPVHWMFWKEDKRSDTADLVTRISLHNPPLIHSKIAWHGKSEYLFILSSFHGPSWRPIYESQEWYPIIVPQKQNAPTTRSLNLRKRRAPPGALREPSRSPGLEDDADELPTITSAPAPKSRSRQTAPVLPAAKPRSSRVKVQARRAPSPSPTTETVTPVFRPATLPPKEILTPLSDIIELSPEPSVSGARRKRKISPPSCYPENMHLLNEMPPPYTEGSLLLGPARPGAGIPSNIHQIHTRNRSTSTESSSTSTIVQSEGSRSSSVNTVVESNGNAPASSGKRKAAVMEDPVEEEDINDIQLDVEESEEKRTTRGRSTRSRKATHDIPTVPPVKPTRAAAAQSSRKRARKA